MLFLTKPEGKAAEMNIYSLFGSKYLVSTYIILITCQLSVSGKSLQLYITSAKSDAQLYLETARREASTHGNTALGEFLMNLHRQYGQRLYWPKDQQGPSLDQLVFGLEPVLARGVANLSDTINTTLDRLSSIVDSVQQMDFLEQSERAMQTQLDHSISSGRRATEEVKMELFGNILHIMGEYFKGFMVASPPLLESSLEHPRLTFLLSRSLVRLSRRSASPDSDKVREIAQQTSDIINNQADLILDRIDAIGEQIKAASNQVWTLVQSTRQFGPLFDGTTFIKKIFDKDWDKLLVSSDNYL